MTDLYESRYKPTASGITCRRYNFPGKNVFFAQLVALSSFVEMLKRTIQIDTHKVDIEEKGIKLKLTVVDTPGYGDAIDNSQW